MRKELLPETNTSIIDFLKSTLWGFFYSFLYFAVGYLRNFYKPNLFGLPVSSKTSKLADELVQNFALAFSILPLLSLIFVLYWLLTRLAKYRRIVDGIFTFVFVTFLYPMEYVFMRIIFLFVEAENVSPLFKKVPIIVMIIILGNHLEGVLYKLVAHDQSEIKAWDKALGRSWARMGGYFIVVFTLLTVGVLVGAIR